MESPSKTIPESRPARWTMLRHLIATWYSASDDGGYEAEVLRACETPLPLAVQEFYAAFGRRNDVWSKQDALIAPDDLRLVNGVLEFYVENQGVTSWALRESDLRLDDPPVIVRDEVDEWVIQSATFSEFMLQMFTFAVQFGEQPVQIHGFAHPACAQRLKTDLPRLGFPEFIWTRSNLLGFDDLIVCLDGSDHVSASALNSQAMEPFCRIIDGGDFEIIVAIGDEDRNGV